MRWIIAVLLACLPAACGQPGDGPDPPHAAAGGPDLSVILADGAATSLSDYGLFADAGAHQPADGVIAYDLINPLFSDHASKHRFVFVPGGEAATYRQDVAFDFPVGTVLIKTFAFAPDMRTPDVDERYEETRLLIHKAEGWVAYPYVWNAAGTEAVYTPAGSWHELSFIDPAGEPVAFEYRIPNQNQCKTCHQMGDTIAPIGPKARNLDHVGPNGKAQLADWSARGMLSGLPEGVFGVPDVNDATRPISARARAYLDINCGHCHQAEGAASNSGLWLGWTVEDPVKTGIGKHPTAAGRGSGDSVFVIAPGAPDNSILTYRMASTEPGVAMPELGRGLVDEDGVALVRDWIGQMTRGP